MLVLKEMAYKNSLTLAGYFDYCIEILCMNKKQNSNRDGFYMNVTQEERKLIEELKANFAINLSQAFKLFLKQMKEKLEK